MTYQLEKLTVARLTHAFTKCESLIVKSNTTGFLYKTTMERCSDDLWVSYNIELNGEILPEHKCFDTPEKVLYAIQKYDNHMKWWQETVGIRDLK